MWSNGNVLSDLLWFVLLESPQEFHKKKNENNLWSCKHQYLKRVKRILMLNNQSGTESKQCEEHSDVRVQCITLRLLLAYLNLTNLSNQTFLLKPSNLIPGKNPTWARMSGSLECFSWIKVINSHHKERDETNIINVCVCVCHHWATWARLWPHSEATLLQDVGEPACC